MPLRLSHSAASNTPPSRQTFAVWKTLQVLVWLVGVGIVFACIVAPDIGLHAFWNVLIPVAPALLVLAPGVWRNICPLALTALAPRRLGLSRGIRLTRTWQAHLALLGVVLLLALVPVRHIAFDTSGPATAAVLLALALVAVTMGWIFEGKSGWCSGVCPVHPVERLYGQAPVFTVANAQCTSCTRCVTKCPEGIRSGHPLSLNETWSRRLAGTLLIGGFPGFIWGWFQVPDFALAEGLSHAGQAFAWPLVGLVVTLGVYLAARAALPDQHRSLIRVFAAASVACYYWFRVPALFGFGIFPRDGMLFDLTETLPSWFPVASQITTTVAFAYLLVVRHSARTTWTIRPPLANEPAAATEPMRDGQKHVAHG